MALLDDNGNDLKDSISIHALAPLSLSTLEHEVVEPLRISPPMDDVLLKIQQLELCMHQQPNLL